MIHDEVMNKEPVTDVAIRFQDCDPFGHLNNARYIDYFINVRENHLAEHYGLDIYARQKEHQTNWVVSSTKIAYLAPVVFREKVSIQTRLIHYNGDTVLMEGVMLDKRRQSLKSVVWITFRHFNLASGQRVNHCKELMELFDKILKKGIKTTSFDERVKEIIRLQKEKSASLTYKQTESSAA